ncbi:MAG: MoaD/ThiS family protein [Gemmatimonadota bacterium]
MSEAPRLWVGTQKGLFEFRGSGSDWRLAEVHLPGGEISALLPTPRRTWAAVSHYVYGPHLRVRDDGDESWSMLDGRRSLRLGGLGRDLAPPPGQAAARAVREARMTVHVTLPGLLRDVAGPSLALEAETPADALASLRRHPALRALLFEDDGTLRRHVVLFVNDENLRHVDARAPLREGDRLHVLQSVAGG